MFRLVDVETRKAWEPGRFHFPPRMMRETVPPGWYVTLVFELDRPPAGFGQGERLAVRVLARRSNASGVFYTGELVADPITPGLPVFGARVDFEPRHVSGVIRPDDPEMIVHIERPRDAARR